VIIQFSLQGCYGDSNSGSALFEIQIAATGELVVRLSFLALNQPPSASSSELPEQGSLHSRWNWHRLQQGRLLSFEAFQLSEFNLPEE
jgi:hypothetical protein